MKLRKRQRGVERENLGPGDQPAQLLDGQQDRDARDQGHEGRVFQQGEVNETLDRNPHQGADGHAPQNGQEEAAGEVEKQQPHVGADGVDRCVGDVQDAHDPVDERQAQGDQGVDRSRREAVQ